MVIQCDQCNAKFKLDDSKVSEKGTKVRCSKCKHIFVVQKEISHEEPDFDSLLSGLDASAPASGLAQPAEKASPAPAGGEPEPFARGSEPPGEEPTERTVADGPEAGGPEEFGEDFFFSKEAPADVAPQGSEFDFGEIPIGEERTSAPTETVASPEAPAEETQSLDFGEFSFAEEPLAASTDSAPKQEAALGETDGLGFGEFSFETENTSESAAASAMQEEAPKGNEDFELGFADFEPGGVTGKMVSAGSSAGPAAEPAEEAFSFGEEPAMPTLGTGISNEEQEPPGENEEAFDFSFMAGSPEEKTEAESESPVSQATDTNPAVKEEVKKGTEAESLDFGDIDFGETVAVGPAVTRKETLPPAADATFATQAPSAEAPSIPLSSLPMPSAEDELPPLSIATRRKGGAVFPVAVTAIAVLIVLGIAGAGVYVFKEGPAAFDKLGLGFLAKWVGLEAVEEGGIAIKNPVGVFMTNQEAGEIFVVSGEAVNNFKKPRASIQVKATLLGPKGETFMQKTAYCGNVLSKEQLATLPLAKIEGAMGNQFGDSLANLGVHPGKGIPFVIVFNKVPKEAAEFGVEVVGSTVASQ
jgi:predicted Zn finger-like uncharacterized protein